jgi:hypothetical protein
MSETETHASGAAPERPIGLSLFLGLVGAAVVWAFVYTLRAQEALLRDYPRLDSGLWALYAVACPAILLAALVAIWEWKKGGVALALAGATLLAGIEIYAMGFRPPVLRVPVFAGALLLLVRPVWGRFR